MPQKMGGKAISVWMTREEEKEYRQAYVLANKGRTGPLISRSFIVRALLKAYRQGLEVPGLPVISDSDTVG